MRPPQLRDYPGYYSSTISVRIEKLPEWLENNPEATHLGLDLLSAYQGEHTVENITTLLASLNGTSVTSLDLEGNSLYALTTPSGIATVLTALGTTNVTEVNLTYNRLGALTGSGLATVLSALRSTKITVLKMRANHLEDLTGTALATALRALGNSSIASLNLGGNKLGKQSGKTLALMAAALRNTPVTMLNLSVNELNQRSEKELINMIAHLPMTIKEINLGDNRLSPETILALHATRPNIRFKLNITEEPKTVKAVFVAITKRVTNILKELGDLFPATQRFAFPEECASLLKPAQEEIDFLRALMHGEKHNTTIVAAKTRKWIKQIEELKDKHLSWMGSNMSAIVQLIGECNPLLESGNPATEEYARFRNGVLLLIPLIPPHLIDAVLSHFLPGDNPDILRDFLTLAAAANLSDVGTQRFIYRILHPKFGMVPNLSDEKIMITAESLHAEIEAKLETLSEPESSQSATLLLDYPGTLLSSPSSDNNASSQPDASTPSNQK